MIDLQDINAQIKESIRMLNDEYQSLNEFQKLFYPGKLGLALEQYNTNPTSEHAIDVLDATLNPPWFFQKWFFKELNDFFQCKVFSCISLLKKNALLEGQQGRTNYETLFKGEQIDDMQEVLNLMDQKGLLYDAVDNFDQVFQRQDPLKDTKLALTKLNEFNMLDGDEAQMYFDTVTLNKYALDTSQSLIVLHKAGLLGGEGAQANREAIAQLEYPTQGRKALEFLYEKTDLLRDPQQAQINFNKLIENKLNYWTIALLAEMNVSLDQEQFETIVQPEVAGSFYIAVFLLQKVPLPFSVPTDVKTIFVEKLFDCSDILFGSEAAKLWLNVSVKEMAFPKFKRLIDLAEQYKSKPIEVNKTAFLDHLKSLASSKPQAGSNRSSKEKLNVPEPSPSVVSQSPGTLFAQQNNKTKVSEPSKEPKQSVAQTPKSL